MDHKRTLNFKPNIETLKDFWDAPHHIIFQTTYL